MKHLKHKRNWWIWTMRLLVLFIPGMIWLLVGRIAVMMDFIDVHMEKSILWLANLMPESDSYQDTDTEKYDDHIC